MTDSDSNPYVPPAEAPKTETGEHVLRRRAPIVSSILFVGLLILLTSTLRNMSRKSIDLYQILTFVTVWTAILATWASTLVYRIRARHTAKPTSVRGLAMLSSCGIVFAMGLAMIQSGQAPGAYLLPLGVTVALIVSHIGTDA